MGDLYFELKDEVKRADECYQYALEIYREVGDRLGEANTLTHILHLANGIRGYTDKTRLAFGNVFDERGFQTLDFP